MAENDKKSFLADLMEKEAAMRLIAEETGINTDALVNEAQRQQQQAVEGGDPIKGKGVTKSGNDD